MIVLIAGGSGGHVFPAIAVAQRFVDASQSVCLITDQRGARFISEYRNLFVHIEVFPNTSPQWRKKFYLKPFLKIYEFMLWWRCVQSFFTHHNEEIEAMFGFGGIMSVLPMLWGWTTRKRRKKHFRFCALHQSDRVFGRANRMLARWIKTVFTGYPDTQGLPSDILPIVVGTPVRKEFFDIAPIALPNASLRILVLGGSQGAAFWSEVLIKGVALLCSDSRSRIHIYHQCPEYQCAELEVKYQKLGISCEVKPFFALLPEVLKNVHVVFSRAGASTIAELACAGRSAFLVPYPHATDQHQHDNAAFWVSHQASWSCPQKELSGEKIAIFLHECLEDPRRLLYTGKQALNLGRKDAAVEMIQYWRESCEKIITQ